MNEDMCLINENNQDVVKEDYENEEDFLSGICPYNGDPEECDSCQ